MIVYRTFRIHASRFLPNLSNNHICKNMHGHTFNITISCIGKINDKTGFIIDFYDIDHVFNNYVHSKIDHKILNDVEGLDNPTSENLAKWIWNTLHPHLSILSKVTVSEDHGTGIIYSKEN